MRAGEIEFLHIAMFETDEVPFIHPPYLLLMGGPMSVNYEEEYPRLKTEQQIIRKWVTKGRSVPGICLGAQLIAFSLGASVY